jgi:hypothetical protein
VGIKISQFHPDKDQDGCLDTVCFGTQVYIDAAFTPSDPQPTKWVRVSKTDPFMPPQTMPFKKEFFKKLELRTKSIKVEGYKSNQFKESEECITLRTSQGIADKHEYKVITSPCFKRNPRLDQEFDPLTSPAANPDPPGL